MGKIKESRSEYYQVTDGEWIKPAMKNWLMVCCDCGLTHKIDFKVVYNGVPTQGKILLRCSREPRTTASIRAAMTKRYNKIMEEKRKKRARGNNSNNQ